jgi:hypothetical protein
MKTLQAELPHLGRAEWRSCAGASAPADGHLLDAGDVLSDADALRVLRAGRFLLCTGRHATARRLLTALQHRLGWRRPAPADGSDTPSLFRAERRRRTEAHALLARVAILVDGPDFRPRLAGAVPRHLRLLLSSLHHFTPGDLASQVEV